MLLLSSEHLNTIQAHAEAAYPQECCGLLLGTLELLEAMPVRQVSDAIATFNAWNDSVAEDLAEQFASYRSATASASHSRADRYWIDPKDMLRAQRQARDRNLSIVGVYHSHPDHGATPSECDRAIAWSDYSYVIVAVHQGRTVTVQSWTLDENRQFQAERMGELPPQNSHC